MKKTDIILIAIIGAFIGIVGARFFFPLQQSNLGASFSNVSKLSSAGIINTSSTPGTNGAIIITNASNTGVWFDIRNVSAARGWCGAATATSSVANQQGIYLTSALPSSTATGGKWEAWGIDGPIACIGDAGFAISFSYSGR